MRISPHFRYVDGLRALAILAVVAFHLDERLLPGGYGGVDIFFVISGFVVSAALYRLNASSLSEMLAGFYVRRLRRILPALVVMLLVVQFAVILFVPQAYLSRFIPNTGLAAFWGVSNFYLAWNTDYFSPLAHYNPFTHTWSLAVEEQFYVMFPFLLYVLTRGRRITSFSISAMLLVCIVSLVYGFVEGGNAGAFYSSFGRFWEIGLGVLLFMWFEWRNAVTTADMPRAELHILTWVSAGLIATSLVMPLAKDPVPGALLPVAGAALLIISLHGRDIKSWPGRFLASPLMVWIGLLSYSLYLWHWPVFVLARWTFGFAEPLQKSAALVVASGLAAASYYWVERPVRTWRHLRRASSGAASSTCLDCRKLRAGSGSKAADAFNLVHIGVARAGSLVSLRPVGRRSRVSRGED